MSSFIDILSLVFDTALLYIYFHTMFRKRRNFPFYVIVLIFAASDIVFYGLTLPLVGNVSLFATLLRTFLTIFSNFLISFIFYAGIWHRLLVILSYSLILFLCEDLSFYIISHFTDTTIVLNELPEATFTAISLFSDILILFITMILHICIQRRSDVQSKTYAVLLLLIPALSCIMEVLPPFFRLNATDPYAYLILTTFLLIINIVNYILLQNILRAEALEQETSLLSEQIETQKRKYQRLGDSYKNIRSFMHDTKKHLFYIETCVNEADYDRIIPYCREMMSDLEARYCTVNTGCLVIDAFVSDLIMQTKHYNIELLTSIKVEKRGIPEDDYHLAIILGNLFDNAINACKNEIGAEINLKIQTVEHVFAIYITNTYHFPVNQNPPKTFENLDFIHGYGLQNVKNSAEACGGFCRIDYADCIYSAMVILPLSEETLPLPSNTIA